MEFSRKLKRNQSRVLTQINTCREPWTGKSEVRTAKVITITDKDRDRMKMGARNWAGFNASDPFAYSVAVSHMNSGISSFFMNEKGDRQEGFYDAKRSMETRHLPVELGGTPYNVEIFVEGRRP